MRVWVVFAALLIAGCTAPVQAPPESEPFTIEMNHDHNNHALHTDHFGFAFHSWNTLGMELGVNGYANFVFYEETGRYYAFVAVDGDTHGGFVIAEITDPEDVQVIGSYIVDGSSFQEVRVSPDGNWAVLNVQDLPDNSDPLDLDGASDCTICLHVVDISDFAAPRLSSVYPVELLGSHNMHFEDYDGTPYLFFVHQPLYLPYPDPGNHVSIARLDEVGGEAILTVVADLMYNPPMQEGRSFPHDVLVQDHPDGRKLAYLSHWHGGHVIFDVTNPLQPIMLAALPDEWKPGQLAPIHWIMQEPRARQNGTVYAYSAPEIGSREENAGYLRTIDVTDPENPRQISRWTLPVDIHIPGQFLMSGHTTVPHHTEPLLLVSHYHAGVWLFNTTNPAAPEALAAYQPHGNPDEPYYGPIWWKKPNFNPEGYGPNVYQARFDPRDNGLVWVTDRGTGLYGLQLP